jgi:hypothetical protein
MKLLAGLGALATLISLVRDVRPGEGSRDRDEKQPADGSPAHHADQLATAVKNAWEAEARVRRLRTPWLLPVHWKPAEANLASVPDVVFRSPETGHVIPERERGPMSGDVGTLTDLYAKLPHHRLVVLGPPGSGKSVVVIELTLALLRHRRPGGSTTVTPSFSALVSLLAPTPAPVMSRSVLAETEDAVAAPALSQRRWKVGRGTFSPERGSESSR